MEPKKTPNSQSNILKLEREVGGGIGMGNKCKPMAVSFQCMTKSTTIKKKKVGNYGRWYGDSLKN